MAGFVYCTLTLDDGREVEARGRVNHGSCRLGLCQPAELPFVEDIAVQIEDDGRWLDPDDAEISDDDAERIDSLLTDALEAISW